MNIGISNFIKPFLAIKDYEYLLDSVDSIDVAPGIELNNCYELKADLVGKKIKKIYQGKRIQSLQGIFFGLNNVSLVQEHDKFKPIKNRLNFIIEMADIVEASYVIFGAPSLRANRTICLNEVYDRVNDLASLFRNSNSKLIMEPASTKLGSEFIENPKQLHEMLNRLNNPNIASILDLGNVIQEFGSLENFSEKYNYDHIHICADDYSLDRLCNLNIDTILNLISDIDPEVILNIEVQPNSFFSDKDLKKLFEFISFFK